jgi:transposase
MLKTLNVGIDISSQEHALRLLDEAGNPQGATFAIANNRSGAQALVERLDQVAVGYDQVLIGLEATGISWWHRHRFLQQGAEQASPPRRVVVFNPKVIHGFQEVSTAMDKTDPQARDVG